MLVLVTGTYLTPFNVRDECNTQHVYYRYWGFLDERLVDSLIACRTRKVLPTRPVNRFIFYTQLSRETKLGRV